MAAHLATRVYDPTRAPKSPYTVREQQKYHQGSGTSTSDYRTFEQVARHGGMDLRLLG